MVVKNENFIEKFLPKALVSASGKSLITRNSENALRNEIVRELRGFSHCNSLYKGLYVFGEYDKEVSFKKLIGHPPSDFSEDFYLNKNMGGTDIVVSKNIFDMQDASQEEVGNSIGIEVKTFKEEYRFGSYNVNTSKFFSEENIQHLSNILSDNDSNTLHYEQQFRIPRTGKITNNLCGQFLSDICRGAFVVNLEKYVSNKFYFCGVVQNSFRPSLDVMLKNMETLIDILRRKGQLYCFTPESRNLISAYLPANILPSVAVKIRVLGNIKINDSEFNTPYWGWVESLGRYTCRNGAF